MKTKSFGLRHIAENLVKFEDKLLRKLILSNTIVLCLTSLLDAICVNVDEMVASRMGKEAMTAVGLSSPTFYIICVFTGVIAFGSQSLCSLYIGKNDKKK